MLTKFQAAAAAKAAAKSAANFSFLFHILDTDLG